MFAFRNKSSGDNDSENNSSGRNKTLPHVTDVELQIFYAMKNFEQRFDTFNAHEHQKEKYRKNFQIKMANTVCMTG